MQTGNATNYHGKPVPDPVHPGDYLREFNAPGALGALNLIIKVLGPGVPTKVVEHEGEIIYTLNVDTAAPAEFRGRG